MGIVTNGFPDDLEFKTRQIEIILERLSINTLIEKIEFRQNGKWILTGESATNAVKNKCNYIFRGWFEK